MIRETSIEAYNTIKENGVLSKRRFDVYHTLFVFGPLTASWIFHRLGLKTNQSGRLTELRDMGFIKEVGKVKCDFTGMTVIQWDVTDRSEPVNLALKEPSDGLTGGMSEGLSDRLRSVLTNLQLLIDYSDDAPTLKTLWNDLSDCITDYEATLEELRSLPTEDELCDLIESHLFEWMEFDEMQNVTLNMAHEDKADIIAKAIIKLLKSEN